jgi:hypothetical protein
VRRTLAGLASVVLLASLGACDDDGDTEPRPPPDATSSTVATIGVLTPASPVVRVDKVLGGPPEVVDLRIGPIQNPMLTGFHLRVVLETVDGERSEYHLGRVSLFPPDNPGTFVFRVPEEAARQLAAGRQAALVVHLEPVAQDMPLREPLALVVAAARLRAA